MVTKTKYLGGSDAPYYDEILEFDPLNRQWKLVDRMIQTRAFHAVSVVSFESIRPLCSVLN